MALKKSQIYSSLWQSCDELRGGMDASQYKDYVLTLLFMKYVSDRYAGDPDALIDVPPGGGFADMAALKGDKEIGDRINKIIGRLAEANDLKGVIDQADFNDESRLGAGREMQDRLSRLVAIFEGLDFRANRAGGDDLLGDAYEYLMRHFATESGKSKGQFYTPAEVSRIMAQVVGVGPDTRPDRTLYDPTCGSGSLLLKAADRAPDGISVYGQEMDNATWALARMNMILHGHPTAELRRGNTLAAPEFRNPDGGLRTFDFAVANPPFSAKAWSNGLDPAHDEFGRFAYGVPPAKNGDYAFLLHLVGSLKSTGRGAVILPHGVLFRGNREAGIRRELVRRGFVKGVIGLPANLFYGTGIPACILVIDKAHAHARKGVFLVDASRGFRKDGPKNRLRAQDVHRIVDVFNRQIDVPGYARMAPLAEIAAPANDYNLNIPRYVDAGAPEDLHDLDAHLRGGVPDRDLDALGACWRVFPALRNALFEPIPDRGGYSRPRIAARQVQAAIRNHDEFDAYRTLVADVFAIWRRAREPRLRNLNPGDAPADLIDALSETLLDAFADVPLLDRYDVYQRLMDYWDEMMRDDVDLVTAAGWVEAARPRAMARQQDEDPGDAGPDGRPQQVQDGPDPPGPRRRALLRRRTGRGRNAAGGTGSGGRRAGGVHRRTRRRGRRTGGRRQRQGPSHPARRQGTSARAPRRARRTRQPGGKRRACALPRADGRRSRRGQGGPGRASRVGRAGARPLRHADRNRDSDPRGRRQVARRHPRRHRRRGAAGDAIVRGAPERAGGPVRPAAARAGTGRGALQREGRGPLAADGGGAVSRRFDFGHLVELCRRTHDESQRSAARAADTYLVTRNWLFGWYIVEYEEGGADRSRLYGKRLMARLSDELKSRGLKGCSPTNLRKFREFYRAYPDIRQTLSVESPVKRPPGNRQTLSVESLLTSRGIASALSPAMSGRFSLGWSHYVTLLTIEDADARRFYEIEAAEGGWSVRELKRQTASSLYERLALSRDKTEVRRLSREGQVIEKASDLVKDPLVLEFLGLDEKPAYSETELETAIIDRLQHFLLELGKGFLFEARQKRFTFDNSHFFVDLVFYNRLLRCYVLIDADVRQLLRPLREDRRRTADRRHRPLRRQERRGGRTDPATRRQHLHPAVPTLPALETGVEAQLENIQDELGGPQEGAADE